ncbi:MAG TPA: PhoH family protein [Thermotogota bacterium]|nr:PhoH family protein [Thermotogota bacterium]HRW92691.1 PhoH family protein [Thermotogota bacterium]
MVKNFVLDTNVLLHDPDSLGAFEDNHVHIPMPVLEELDKFKRNPGQIGANCREVVRRLDELRTRGDILKGIQTQNGGTVQIALFSREDFNRLRLPAYFNKVLADNWILMYALKIQENHGNIPTILVTKDINLRIKSQTVGVDSQDYLRDKSKLTRLTGFGDLSLSSASRKAFAQKGELHFSQLKPQETPEENYHPNQYLDLGEGTLGRVDSSGEKVIPLTYSAQQEVWGIRARNREQVYALDALLDDSISLVTLTGMAGTGKTLLALAAGLQNVLDEKEYERLTATKPVIPMGKDIGFLPGSAEEKVRPWVQPIFDNLEFLFGNRGKKAEEFLKSRNLIEIEILSYIRGRSIPGQFILIDEAQNLTPHEVKTIITRVGEKTKIIFTGDPDQIDNPYLDKTSNGLVYLASRFMGDPLAAHVSLLKGERSALASRAAQILS